MADPFAQTPQSKHWTLIVPHSMHAGVWHAVSYLGDPPLQYRLAGPDGEQVYHLLRLFEGDDVAAIPGVFGDEFKDKVRVAQYGRVPKRSRWEWPWAKLAKAMKGSF